MDRPPFNRLPKYMQRLPGIRARYTAARFVCETGRTSEYRVKGSNCEYTVIVYGDTAICECIAHKNGMECYHKIAAIQKEKERMSAPRYTPQRQAEYVPKQAILIEPGFYFGFFRGYGEPREVDGYNGNGREIKVPLSFLVTHHINERPMPQVTEAVAFPKFKRFFDPKKNMRSKYSEFEYAVLASRSNNPPEFSEAWLIQAGDEEIPSLDEMVGLPALLQVETSKPDKHGVRRNNIQVWKPVPKESRKVLVETYRSLQFGTTDKGLKCITSPPIMYDETFKPFAGAAPAAAVYHHAPAMEEPLDPEELPY